MFQRHQKKGGSVRILSGNDTKEINGKTIKEFVI